MATALRAVFPAHPTRSNLGAESRAVIAKFLNQRLADAIDLQLQAKQIPRVSEDAGRAARAGVGGVGVTALGQASSPVATATADILTEVARFRQAGVVSQSSRACGAVCRLEVTPRTPKGGEIH